MSDADRGAIRMVLGVAWYREEQWQRLREISADVTELEETYGAWLLIAMRKSNEMTREGIAFERVEVDVEDLVVWCLAEKRPVNSASRAAYVAEWLRKRTVERRGG